MATVSANSSPPFVELAPRTPPEHPRQFWSTFGGRLRAANTKGPPSPQPHTSVITRLSNRAYNLRSLVRRGPCGLFGIPLCDWAVPTDRPWGWLLQRDAPGMGPLQSARLPETNQLPDMLAAPRTLNIFINTAVVCWLGLSFSYAI